jgi:SAM-dependent methyltransferase
VNPDQLETRIAEFVSWTYRFEFDNGVSTPLLDRGMVKRQEQRRHYFFDALIDLFGGSLSGLRVLDLGCGCGFWALQAIEAGADFVLGVDADETQIGQAQLVFEAKGIDPSRYRFIRENIFAADLSGHFDVVLCLALMHQISRPVELFELMCGVGAEIILIETALARSTSSSFEVSSPRKPVDHNVALVPSRAAVIELACAFDLSTVALARNMTNYAGLDDYRRQLRLAFFCSSGKPLDTLAAEDQWITPWWLTPLAQRGMKRLRG